MLFTVNKRNLLKSKEISFSVSVSVSLFLFPCSREKVKQLNEQISKQPISLVTTFGWQLISTLFFACRNFWVEKKNYQRKSMLVNQLIKKLWSPIILVKFIRRSKESKSTTFLIYNDQNIVCTSFFANKTDSS